MRILTLLLVLAATPVMAQQFEPFQRLDGQFACPTTGNDHCGYPEGRHSPHFPNPPYEHGAPPGSQWMPIDPAEYGTLVDPNYVPDWRME